MEDVIRIIFPIGDLNSQTPERHHKRCFSPISTTLIIGPPHVGKSALLFQAAVSEGTAGGQAVFVMPTLPSELPPAVHGMPQPSSTSMENINFLYAACSAHLQEYLASLHLKPKRLLPSLVVVDDLERYVPIRDSDDGPQILVNLARTLSMIQDAAGFCQSLLKETERNNYGSATANSSCNLLMAWTTHGSYPLRVAEIKSFVKNYCNHVWTVKQTKKGLSKECHMTKTLLKASYSISFIIRNIPQTPCDVILKKVVVETEE